MSTEPYYQDDRATLYRADALAVLAGLPTASVDALITDPPYSSGGQVCRHAPRPAVAGRRCRMSHDPKYDVPEITCPDCGERCDICDDRMCATYGPTPAVTCDAHRHCEDCDGDNTCRDCATERRAA